MKVPVLIIYSEHDTTVLPSESSLMAGALKQARKPVTTVTLTGDDHYLEKSASRVQMLQALEGFLATNLPTH